MLPYTAYLRVYEPLEAFPEPERSWWEAYGESAGRPRRVEALQAEHAEALRTLIREPEDGLPVVHESQNAYVRRFHGKLLVSPWRRRLRSWAAFSAAQGLSVAGEETPHIIESSWHIPLEWFVPFIRGERWLELGGVSAPPSSRSVVAPPRTLTYVTSISRARSRLERARAAQERLDTEISPFGNTKALADALSGFHPRALVELDYGGLVHLMDDETLAADDSVAESAVALVALERDELELAVAMQLRLRARWRAIRALHRAN